MANSIYAVHSGKHTVYEWIKKVLIDIGVPSTGLEPVDHYDTAIDKKIEDEIKKDKDDNKETDLKSGSSSSSSSSNGEDKKVTITKKNETGKTKDKNKRNPFKKTPAGIYDCLTISDYIRTLLFDYGVHVRFYGDINGIPHFEAYDVDKYMRTGLIIDQNVGVEEDYSNTFSIIDIVTQTMIKNISATNPIGELYTSKDIFGVSLAQYVGRMGTIVDNPSTEGGATSKSSGDFKDASGNVYTKDQIFETEMKASCGRSSKHPASGGKVKKYWLNRCGGCNKSGVLKNNPKGVPEGEITCGSCDMDYCGACGYEKINGSEKHLTEVFPSSLENTGSNEEATESTSEAD